MKVYRSTFNYKGTDRFDVTIKTKEHPEFCPTWDMVMGIKKGIITEEEYAKQYHDLMIKSWRKNRKAWEELLSMGEVTLVCFCKKGSFCHTYLLAEYLVKLGAVFMGDR